ncbi:MAG: glycosyltransferase family 2 protein, partial [Prevotellaceae bacterium]|nr:glycosyltransferase family 2 protein [Prevotellaceae bacterium]
RNATLDERYQMKLGFDYVFLNHIKQNTPEDAVILFPLKKCTTEKGGDSQLSGNINSKYWVTHFVYPRRILYKDEQETNSRYSDVTHVAIVAGHGYEDLNYPVMERYYFTVLPKNAAEK